jgi:branched-chain amino acid transport system substrate-binding protein
MKKVYLIGQDYSFGQAVAAGAERMLAEKRPDIEIVGNELHPIGQVQDFTPYARNVKASGADALITGNWGGDMVGLGKAILEADLGIPVYTYYAAGDGITGLFGEAGDGVISLVAEGWGASPTAEFQAYHTAFKAQFPDSDITQPRIINVIGMLAQAMQAAGTTDPKAVAMAMENMEYDSMLGTKVFMRAEDHQAFQNVYINTHTNDGLPGNSEGATMDFDNSGYGLLATSKVEMASMGMETTCEMKRP